MIVRPKHIALSILLLFVSILLFWINWSWGNSLRTCFLLSFYSFIMIFMSWNIYWELRDFWQFRWYRADMLNLETHSYKIPILWEGTHPKYLIGDLLHSPHATPTSPLIVFSYGFSDDRLSSRNLSAAIAVAGYDVFTYDTRGKRESRRVGTKNQFTQIVRDFKDVLDFIGRQPEFAQREIYLVGVSLGAISSINQGIWHDQVQKIIAIASMSNYRDNFPRSTITFIGLWWVWLRYKFFGVIFNPPEEINIQLSPALQIRKLKEKIANPIQFLQIMAKKLYLIHDVMDEIISLENFEELRTESGIPAKNWIVTARGGHIFRTYELVLIAAILAAIRGK
jgi:pimeloyl-ACP methyl ester carboxylesterase